MSLYPDPSPATTDSGYFSVQYDRWLPSLSPSPPPPSLPTSEIPLPPPETPTKRKNGKQMISMNEPKPKRKPRAPKQASVLRETQPFVCITLCNKCKDAIKVEASLLKIALCPSCKTRLLK